MKDKLFEVMFDDLIKRAGTAAILEMESENAEEEEPEVEFSKEHEEKMKKFFEEYRKQEAEAAIQNEINMKHQKVKKTVSLAAATVVVLALGITTVGAWKGSLLNSYVKDNGEYSELLNGKAERDFTVENVYFGYVPEKYEFVNVKDGLKRKYINFKSTDGETYFNLEINKDLYKEKVDSESGEVAEMVINDKDMIVFEKDGLNIIAWYENDSQNTLYTNADVEMLIKIAEKIEFLK